MEDGLGQGILVSFCYCKKVLILVLVEDGLGLSDEDLQKVLEYCSLNPCFSGRWSRTVN